MCSIFYCIAQLPIDKTCMPLNTTAIAVTNTSHPGLNNTDWRILCFVIKC